jgi:hypothetical protein
MSGMDLPKHDMPRLEARDTGIGYGERKKYRRSASELPAFSTKSGTIWGSARAAAPQVVPACDGRQGDEQLYRERGRYIKCVWGLHRTSATVNRQFCVLGRIYNFQDGASTKMVPGTISPKQYVEHASI